ncbi:MAG TPA: aspartate--tRNA ligase [Solirubrobacterales bacterium]|nr:aspartate--tRNA ligase [Solirubrobacterales bacterium]
MSEFPALRANGYRDAWCGEVLGDRVGRAVRLAGWVHRRRDHGGLAFVDLRDRTGLVQLVFDPDESPEAHELVHRLRSEDVISVSGPVVERDPETVNPDLPTGAYEVRVGEAALLADAETPPFEIEGYSGEVGEEMRLRYRYLDLRRDRMREAIELRHRVSAAIRDFLGGEGFLDVETPMLSRSTPEGARDFLVPSRREPGAFYALPQSPQLFKQLLMVAGLERYFQIVRCFRDEDQRADRQPDFTQLDIEMSFVELDDVLDLNERLLASVFEAVGGPRLELPLRRIPYDEAISRYGTDRPDLRFGLELVELTDLLVGTEFKVFRSVADSGGVVKGINAGARDVPRSVLDGFIARAQELGAKGLVWAFREGEGWRSPTAKFLSAEELRALNERLGAEEGDLLLIVADEPGTVSSVLAQMRLDLAEQFGLVDPAAEEFCWIVDWPMFEWNADENRWDPLHHPFTAPADPEAFDPERAGEARALAYDVVWNGQELGGGSIRIANPDLQRKVLEAIGIGADEAHERFGFLLEALRYGAPPHGGIAYGLDRIVQRLMRADSIRDVIAFPKAASGADPLTGAPAPVDDVQLRDLGLVVKAPRPPQR